MHQLLKKNKEKPKKKKKKKTWMDDLSELIFLFIPEDLSDAGEFFAI